MVPGLFPGKPHTLRIAKTQTSRRRARLVRFLSRGTAEGGKQRQFVRRPHLRRAPCAEVVERRDGGAPSFQRAVFVLRRGVVHALHLQHHRLARRKAHDEDGIRGVFTSPASMPSFSPKSLTIHLKRKSSLLIFPEGMNGVAEKSWHRIIGTTRWIRSSPPTQTVCSSFSSPSPL